MPGVSVVIPVRDGERHLGSLLTALRREQPDEVLVIDSGSRDRSLEIARAAGVEILEIEASEFGHGRTRNIGAERTSGELICFLTQDAVPVEGWLDAYREAFALGDHVGAAYGPHLPRGDTSPMIARELTEFFAGFAPNGRPAVQGPNGPVFLALNLLAVLVFVLATGVDPRLEWLALPLMLFPLGAFAAGIAMLLSALYVRFRDLKPIWEVIVQIAFYASPILYVIEMLPTQTLQHLVVWFNPLATILVQARHSLIDENAPNSWDVAGGFVYLLIPGAIVVALLALGFWVFNREAPRIAEEL